MVAKKKVSKAKPKVKSKVKKRITRKKPRVVQEVNVLETASIKWAMDRNNPVCLLFEIFATGMLIYGLWYHNLYFVLSGLVAIIFGHSYARGTRKR